MKKLTIVNIRNILKRLEDSSLTTAEKGRKFEEFCKAYLLTDPGYAEELEEVWLWEDFPYREGIDAGIDLVARTKDGEYWAIQSKFYGENHQVSKKDIDTFLSFSGKAFTDEENKEYHYSRRLLFSTTDKWNRQAERTIIGQTIPVTRIGLKQLEESGIDWEQFDEENYSRMVMRQPFELRDHQKEALTEAKKHYEINDRGQLIMSCGTGKTFTSLKIVEQECGGNGTVLFLAPSISLVSQCLREWVTLSSVPVYPIVICSDNKASRAAEEAISTVDLIHPATTNPETALRQYEKVEDKEGLKVFFSTYQSIDVVSKVQELSGLVFDIVVCDEAHRTTGASALGKTESYYRTVHDNEKIPAKKRLYMTATPRVYGEGAKKKADKADASISSMDDEKIYGTEFYRLGFAESIRRGLLTDYKVIIMAVDDKYVDKKFRSIFASEDNELSIDDLARIYGIWAGLSKHSDNPDEYLNDPDIMKRGIIYTNTIKESRRIGELFNEVIEEYDEENDGMAGVEVHHIDGKMDALTRSNEIDWLREPTEGEECRILTNARCLSEGVDVPSLDAVAFANPRSSIIDIIQSVGRVMRLDPQGRKKYGYVIIPVAIPSGGDPDKVLDKNNYKIIWNVLRALRAHDERLNTQINQLALEGKKPKNIDVTHIGETETDEGDSAVQLEMDLGPLEDYKDAIYAKLVMKLGDKDYWETWAGDVADISQRHIMRISNLLEEGDEDVNREFETFLASLRENLNDTITKDDAIEMISQHLITRPVFEALFEGYEFTKSNPVSLAIDKVLETLEGHSFETEMESMESFYESVRERVKGIQTVEGRQKVITELYENFFKLAFKKQSEKLGIVYTPTEVVDFILNSVEVLLRKEFGKSLGDKGVEILDPFTGTGTFITRLLTSGIIPKENLEYKYQNEIHANEIVLLAYYIASINIEETYHSLTESDEYEPFEGIVLTDTFQMYENDRNQVRIDNSLLDNNKRRNRQRDRDIQVYIGNPPYSVGQRSQNDNAQNVNYPELNASIAQTYAANTEATNKNALYDSYIKAFRWATDRLPDKGGIIGFVSNGSFIDNQSMDGFRKCLVKDFTDVYIFNLRGNARTSGELRRKEKDNVFGQGTRTTVAITLLVKNPNKDSTGKVHYYDIGDYLTREEKLKAISDFGDVGEIEWDLIEPDRNNDWINQRNEDFEKFVLIGDNKDINHTIFQNLYSFGLETSRDAWCYNFSLNNLKTNIENLISNYNKQLDDYYKSDKAKSIPFEKWADRNPKKINWSSSLFDRAKKNESIQFGQGTVEQIMYRPFQKTNVYLDNALIHRPSHQYNLIDQKKTCENRIIQLAGKGSNKPFSVLILNSKSDRGNISMGQCFPLYWYEKPQTQTFFEQPVGSDGLVRRDAISDWFLEKTRKVYNDETITKEDIFYYIYGILHSEEYRTRFANDLKKSLPRIPFVHDFWSFSRAGRELADLHLNYETVEPYPLEETAPVLITDKDFYRVEKMRFGKKSGRKDKSTIIYNDHITLSGIPEKAYEYVVNGRSAIEWIMEQYRIKTDKDSGIVNDPNDWCKETEDERYIINLLKRIVNVSIQTVNIVRNLPKLENVEETLND